MVLAPSRDCVGGSSAVFISLLKKGREKKSEKEKRESNPFIPSQLQNPPIGLLRNKLDAKYSLRVEEGRWDCSISNSLMLRHRRKAKVNSSAQD